MSGFIILDIVTEFNTERGKNNKIYILLMEKDG